MAATQNGTGSLTAAGQATAAGAFITVPVGAIVESITTQPGGSPIFEDIYDENGAFHTRITYEKDQTSATIVLVGVAYPLPAGAYSEISGYYIESVSEEKGKSAVRTTLVITKL